MKTKRFRLLTVLLAAVMLIALNLTVYAARSNVVTQDGLTVQLFTDKDSYKANESVNATVRVDNHAGKEAFIFISLNVPEGVILASESAAYDAVLQDGESWTTSGGISPASAIAAAGNVTETGDNMQGGFWIILTALAVCGIIALFMYGKNKKTWLSMLLCMAMVSGLTVAAVPAQASDISGNIDVSCIIQVDGKEAEISATVSYIIYDDTDTAAEVAEETISPSETTAPTEEPNPTTAPTEEPVPTTAPTAAPDPTAAPTEAPSEPDIPQVGTTVFVNRTFDEKNKTEFEEITVSSNDNKIEVVEGNNYLKLTKVSDEETTKFQYKLNDTVKHFVAECKVSTDENGVDAGRLFVGYENSGKAPAYLCILSDGSISLPDMTTVVGKVEAGKWVRTAIAVDLNTKAYDVYVDDEIKAANVAIEKDVTSQSLIITTLDKGTGSTGAVLLVDDIKAYEGLAPEGITPPTENVWVEETLVDRTFDETDKEALAEIIFNSATNTAEVVKGGNYLKMYRPDGGNQPTITLAGPGSKDEYAGIKNFVAECDVSTESTVPQSYFIWGQGGGSKQFLSLATGGAITVDGEAVGTIEKGKWLKVAVVFNLEAKNYAVYSENQLIKENIAIDNDELVNAFDSISIRLRNKAVGDMLIDNIKVYEGTTPWTDIYAEGYTGKVLVDRSFDETDKEPLAEFTVAGNKNGSTVEVVDGNSHIKLTKATDSAEDIAQIQYKTNNDAKDLTRINVECELSTKNGVDAGSIFKLGDDTYLYLNADGTVTLPEGDAYKTVNDDKLIGTISTGRWLKLVMEVDLETKTYKISANGEAVTADMPLLNADNVTEIPATMTTGFNTGTGNTNADLLVDNLKVTGEALRQESDVEVGNAVFVDRSFDETDKEEFAELQPYVDGKNKVEVVKGNNYLSLSKTSDGAVTQIQYNLNDTVKYFVAECELSTVNGIDKGRLFMGRAGSGMTTYLYLAADGTVTLPDKSTVVATVTSDKWVKIAIAVDLNSQTYDVYVDGTMTHEDVALPKAADAQPVIITRFDKETGNTGKELLIDNLKVYEGLEPRELVSEEDDESYEKKLIYLDNSVAEGYLGDMKAVQLNADTIYADKVKSQTTKAINNIDGKVYLTEADIKTLFGESVTLASAHSSTEGYYDVDATAEANGYIRYELEDRLLLYSTSAISLTDKEVAEVNRYMQFERPTAETVLKLHDATIGTAHPRVLVTQSDIDQIKTLYAANDTYMKAWGDNAIAAADKAIAEQAEKGGPLYDYHISGGSMVHVDLVLPMLMNTGMAYFITGDSKYAQAAWVEIENICKLDNWNPASYLDIGELSAIVGLGYDWFYDYLSADQKAFIEEALIRQGVGIQHKIYNGYYKNNDEVYWTWWDNTNNWNVVCNGGTMIGAIAIFDKYPEMCSEVIANSVRGLEFMMASYFPEGAWHEGGGYWRYALEYFAFTMKTFDNAFGDDFGFLCSPGLESTGWFGLKLAGSTAINNYGDASLTFYDNEAVLWCADVYNDPDLAAARIQEMELLGYAGDGFDMALYNPELLQGASANVPLDTVIDSMAVVSLRERWYDKGATFLGFSGMKPKSGHAHMDTGTFVVDMLGERIIMDSGAEDYNAKGYFSTERYKYYRARPEGHNIYVINPTSDAADYGGFTPWVKAVNTPIVSKARGAYSTLDLSQVYREDTTSAIRGYILGDDRRSVTVRDEIVLRAESEIYSFLHTKAEVEMENENTAILTLNGKKFKVSIVVDGDNVSSYTFGVVEAKSMYDYGVSDSDNTVAGVRKLQICVKASGQVNITMRIIGYDDPAAGTAVNTIPIANWSADMIADGDAAVLPTLDMIYVDGEPLKNFDPTVTGYTSRLSYAATLPTVTASSLTCTKIEVTNAEDFGKDYVIKVYADGNDDLYRVYRVSFTKLPTLEAIDGMTRYSVKAVTACCIQEEALGNIPENVIDNDFTTSRWTAESVALGESHEITLELDDVSKVNKIGFAFYNGHKRYTIFAVHVSTDGNAWTEVFNGNSSGTTAALEYFYESDAGIDAKYVRFTGYGNSKNGWNNITEFVVLGGN